MQNWDQLVMVILGLGVAGHTGYLAWQSWRRRQKLAASGLLLVGVITVALPLALAALRG